MKIKETIYYSIRLSSIRSLLEKYKILVFTGGIIVFFWFLETITHIFVFQEKSFSQQLFIQNLNPHETWMRLIVVVVIALSAIITFNLLSKKRKIRKALDSSEKKYKTIIENTNEVIVLSDKNNSIDYISPSCYEIFGYSSEELMGQSLQIILTEEKNLFEDFAEKSRKHANGSQMLYMVSTKNKEVKYIRHVWKPVLENGELKHIVSVLRDVTEQYLSNEAMQISENRLAEAQHIANLGNWEWDIKSNKLKWSDEVFRIFGYEPDEFEPTFEIFMNSIHPQDRTKVKKAIARSIKKDCDFVIKNRIIHLNKDVKHIYSQGKIKRDKDGNPKYMIGIVQDMTDKILIEQEIEDKLKVQIILNKLLALSNQQTGLKSFLKQSLKLILQLPFTETVSKGSIFLSDSERNLHMAVQKDIGKFMEENCATVPCGKCLCGMAAKTGEVQYANCVDRRHKITYKGIEQHAHYNIPILQKKKLLGVLNVYLPANHPRNEEEIRILEMMTNTLALIITRKKYESEIIEQFKVQTVLNQLLAISHKEANLPAILDKALKLIFKLPFTALLPKGAIFLSDENGDLKMTAKKDLGEYIEQTCAIVPSGKCLCGMAAKTKKLQHTDCVDHRHETTYKQISQHAHYNVPILSNDKLLGVLNIYLPAGHQKDDHEIEILESITNTLALIIRKHKSEEKIIKNEVKFRSVIETANDAIIILNQNELIISWNKSAERIFGYKIDEIFGQSFSIIIPRKNKSAQKNGLNTSVFSDKIYNKDGTIELEAQRKNKEVFPIELSSTTWERNNRKYNCCIIRDISERKESETQLYEKNLELETFIYKSSHDMKGPLSSISGLVNVANMNITDKEGLYYFDLIGTSIQKMENVLNDLTKVAIIKQGNIEIYPIKIVQLINNVIETYKYLPDYNNLEFKITSNVNGDYYSDPKLLGTIFGNIIENCIKYQMKDRKDRFVNIDIKNYNKEIKLKISDNGVGIPKDHLCKIFDMFYRANEFSQGTGLGLYIVKNAVEKLKGTISIKSKLKVGTQTYIELPNLKKEVSSKISTKQAAKT